MSAYEEGDPDSDIALVMEAPAQNEMREGRPAIGPAGGVLDTCLHQSGLIRRECYILNIWEKPVTKSKDGAYFMDGKLIWTSRKGFTDTGLRLADPCLKRLRKCKANVAVTLGAPATDLLTDRSQILKWRGSPLTAIDPEGLTVIPTIHPAASLRGKFLWRYGIISDLNKARKHRHRKTPLTLKRNGIIDPSYSEVMDFLPEIKSETAVDIECYNNAVSCMSFAPDKINGICIPFFMPGKGSRWSERQEIAIWLQVARIMGDKNIDKIGQNLTFDMSFLYDRNNIITEGRIRDCMIAWAIAYPELADKKNGFGKGLDILTSFFTDEPYYKGDLKLWDKIDVDPITFWNYNMKDSFVCMDIWPILFKELNELDYIETYELVEEILPILVHMMSLGIKINHDALEKTRESVEKQIADRTAELHDVTGIELNPLSPKQCIQYFYGIKGLPPYTSYKTGNPTCDDKALQRIYRKTNMREAKLCQEIRGLTKQMSYLDFEFDEDGRLRCSYNPQGTKFGRLSSSKTIRGTGLNMLNLTPEFKRFMEAD